MVLPWLSSLWGSVSSWFTGMDWASLGRSIVQGIINGLNAMGGALSGALQSIVDAAIARIKALLGISSPSKVTTYFGKMIGQGLVNGVLGQVGNVRGAMGKLLGETNMGNVGFGGNTLGGRMAPAGGGYANAADPRSVVINIDARGAARGVDRDLRAMIEDVMRQYGRAGDARVRTG